ncbi:hypothetical protein QAD02_002813 [Eretmocerus hayati]|uniref:Uncharacterized protein n=1 Tax=Eretmocerus hayati TaxID=131215 RepID=A0ACC2NMK2_9HYME|nr:hypothetical protein QAD02_002813 [Eretmocerus hayati]
MPHSNWPVLGHRLRIGKFMGRFWTDGRPFLPERGDTAKSKPSTSNTAPASNSPYIVIAPAPQQVQENQSNSSIVIGRIENGQEAGAEPPQNQNPGGPKKNQYKSDKPEIVNFDLHALLESSASG